MSSNVLAEGTLYLDRQENGVFTGIKQLLGVAKFSIKANSDLKEAVSKDLNQYGNITASVAINKPADLSVTLRQIDSASLAMAWQGSEQTYSQGAGTITDEAVVAKLGRHMALSKRNITEAGFSVTNTAGTTTYVLNTDYRVNYFMGTLEVLATGAITEAQALKVSFSHAAITGSRVLGGTVAQIKGKLILDGRNLVDGKRMILTIPDATLTSDADIDLMSDDFSEVSFKGRMTKLANEPAAFYIDYELQAVA